MHRSPTPPACARRRSLSAAVRAVSVTAGAVAAVAVCALAAPAAAASAAPAEPGPSGPIHVTPRQAEPGSQVELRTEHCDVERTAFATSVAFEADVDLERTSNGTAFHGYAVISVEAEVGTYGLTVVCGEHGKEGQGSFKVVSDGGGGNQDGGWEGDQGEGWEEGRDEGWGDGSGEDGRSDHEPPHDPYASPVAPVRAGGGGTAGDSAGGGAETAQRIGLSLAGGAAVAGAVTWAVRRRRAGTHSGG